MVTLVLVTGGRKYAISNAKERWHVYNTLDAMQAHYGEIMLIEGDALGADKCAGMWAEDRGVHCAKVSAIWNKLGPSAGPRRNSAMLRLRPDICVVFPGGVGTADMAKKARAAGVPTYEV